MDEKIKIMRDIEKTIMSFNNDLIKMGENKIIPPDKLSINFFNLEDKGDDNSEKEVVVPATTIDAKKEDETDITHLL
jgi:hypothetical protein